MNKTWQHGGSVPHRILDLNPDRVLVCGACMLFLCLLEFSPGASVSYCHEEKKIFVVVNASCLTGL